MGGGAGYYSFWLQEKGHNVTLVDLSPENIELVRKHSETTGRVLKKFETGDAVHLNFSDEQFDIVLLLGPLYRLTSPKGITLPPTNVLLQTGPEFKHQLPATSAAVRARRIKPGKNFSTSITQQGQAAV